MVSAPGVSSISESPVGALSLPPPTSFKHSPSVESFRSGSRSASASGSLALEYSEGVDGCPREEGCVEVVLPLLSRLLNQMPQQPNFALDRIVLSDDALQRTFSTCVGSEDWVSCSWVWMCLSKRKADDSDGAPATADIINDGCWA
jgi:hypothetical protein